MQNLSILAQKIPKEAWETIWHLPDDISIPDWVEKNIMLSEKMAAEPGPLRISRTPYVKGSLEALGNVFIEEVVLVWGRQLGKSTGVQYAFACYVVAQDPGPATFLLPTRDKAKEISETKLDPIFRACPEVMKRMPTNPDDYTKLRMNFQTMIFAMAWAGSDTQTTTRSNRFLFIDEADEIPKTVGENAIDPIKGIEQTMTTFSNRKILKTSTPTTPEGNIWQALKECQFVFEYWVACPHCGGYQILYWDLVKFGDDHDPVVVEEMAYYECEHCHGRISNIDKIRILASGEWRARIASDPSDQIRKGIHARIEDTISLDDVLKNKKVKTVGFHLPKWYSPFSGGSLGVIAKEFLEANKALKDGQDYAPMRNWRIYNAALPWEEIAISETEVELMKNQIDIPRRTCPQDTIALTAGIDPGQGGFWYVVLAWRKDQGPHLLDFGWRAGDYETSQISDLMTLTYPLQAQEREMTIFRMGVDTGGSEYGDKDVTMTAAAYEWIRSKKSLRLFGTKGLSRDIPKRLRETRIDKMPGDKGIPIPGGLVLIEINTDAIKNLVWFRLNRNLFDCATCKATTRFNRDEIKTETPIFCKSCGAELPKRDPSGMFTFHAQVEEEYIQHILAEQLRLDIKTNQWEWVRIRKANHLLDCTVIAFAMADSEFRGGIRVIRPQGQEGKPDPNKMPSINPVTHRPRGGWMNK